MKPARPPTIAAERRAEDRAQDTGNDGHQHQPDDEQILHVETIAACLAGSGFRWRQGLAADHIDDAQDAGVDAP